MRGPPEGMAVLLVDKPAGPTSHDVVAAVRRGFGGVKAGHAGTLDPFATGLLIVATGRATRILEYLAGLDKEYEAEARLGVATETGDPEGAATATDDRWRDLSEDRIHAQARAMTGRLRQVPPAYSAVKVGGVPAHRRVRRGETVRLAARVVTVHELEATAVDLPLVRFRVSCSSGTYVRSLAAELGRRLGTACHLSALRRTRIGTLRCERAASLESVRARRPPERAWLSAAAALEHLPQVEVDPNDVPRLAQGMPVPSAAPEAACAAFVSADRALVAVGAVSNGMLRPRKVFAS